MRKVMVFGTFDIVHDGHVDFFRQARENGDYLVAVVGRDSVVEKVKGKKPRHNENERVSEIRKFVDDAVLGDKKDMYKVISDEKPNVVCLGYDQNSFSENLEEELEKKGVKAEILRMKPYKADVFKTSKLIP